jgi:hypothetical protein
MLVDCKSRDIARRVGIMAIQIEDRESEHASAELKTVAFGVGLISKPTFAKENLRHS